MFGVAEDLELSGLKGKKLTRLAVSEERVELGFEDDWRVTIECTWRLEHGRDVVAVGGREHLLEEIDKLNVLVGAPVSAIEARPPDRIVLQFPDNRTLTVIDDSDILESFSIDPIGVVV